MREEEAENASVPCVLLLKWEREEREERREGGLYLKGAPPFLRWLSVGLRQSTFLVASFFFFFFFIPSFSPLPSDRLLHQHSFPPSQHTLSVDQRLVRIATLLAVRCSKMSACTMTMPVKWTMRKHTTTRQMDLLSKDDIPACRRHSRTWP